MLRIGFCIAGVLAEPLRYLFTIFNLEFQVHFLLTFYCYFYMQRYRSGHNGADSKSVCEQSHEGSNPSLCASQGLLYGVLFFGWCRGRWIRTQHRRCEGSHSSGAIGELVHQRRSEKSSHSEYSSGKDSFMESFFLAGAEGDGFEPCTEGARVRKKHLQRTTKYDMM